MDALEKEKKMRMIAAMHAHGMVDPAALPFLCAALTLRRFKALLAALDQTKVSGDTKNERTRKRKKTKRAKR